MTERAVSEQTARGTDALIEAVMARVNAGESTVSDPERLAAHALIRAIEVDYRTTRLRALIERGFARLVPAAAIAALDAAGAGLPVVTDAQATTLIGNVQAFLRTGVRPDLGLDPEP